MTNDKDYETIANSGLFDLEYYSKTYNLNKEEDLILHYIKYWKYYFNPSKNFNTKYYLTKNQDIKNSNMNPFVHYIKYGKDENRKGKKDFDGKKRNILYVLHGGLNGGTFLTNMDLMKNISTDYNIYLLNADEHYLKLYSLCQDEFTLINKYPRNSEWSAKKFHDSYLNYIYYEILTNFKIDIIHIRHLIYHSFDLPFIAKKLDIPVILSFHDFYFICPFYVLVDENYNYCEGVCTENHENCMITWDILKDIHSKIMIPYWRKEVLKLFNHVDCFITTSQIVKDLFLSIYKSDTINDYNFKIIGHGRDFKTNKQILYEIPEEDKIKIAFPANNLDQLKGSDIIKEIKECDENNILEFHFLGNNPQNLDKYGILHGRYERDNFQMEIEKIKPSFIGVFSIWPETYCHTITESWSCGIPVIGNNIGVIKDRISRTKGGFLIDTNNFNDCYQKILSYRNTSKYMELIKNVNKIKFKSTKHMSNEYNAIYKKLLGIEN